MNKASIEKARAALAQKDEQEPKGVVYAYRRKGIDDFCTCDERRYKELSEKPNLFETAVFYTAPPKRKPLTDAGINEIADSMPGGLAGFMKGWGWQQFARAIEAAHGIGVEHDAMG